MFLQIVPAMPATIDGADTWLDARRAPGLQLKQ
jgi:hypothetical protein